MEGQGLAKVVRRQLLLTPEGDCISPVPFSPSSQLMHSVLGKPSLLHSPAKPAPD